MKHIKSGKKFGRKRKVRRALLKGLMSSLIVKRKIKTTEIKAKEVRMMLEPLITRAKADTVQNRRHARKYFNEKATDKLFELAKKYKERQGGYSRIIKLAARKGDGAKVAIIEFVQ